MALDNGPRSQEMRISSPICSCLSWALLVLMFLFHVAHGYAHDAGSSYLKLTVREGRITGRWEIALHDLDEAVKLDANDDGMVNALELRSRLPAATEYAVAHLKIAADNIPARVLVTNAEPVVESSPNGTNVILHLLIADQPKPNTLEVDYRLFFELKPQHRGLLLLECDARTHSAMFSPDRPTQQFDLAAWSPGNELLAFGWEGVWHIWIGFDHILFLLALLLPSVLMREAKRWTAVSDFREAFVNVLRIVTAFTVAHSITLSVASLNLITLPSRWVESAIAASVLLAALNNLRPFFRGRVWLVAFGFGLVHGFGFASVLVELGPPQAALLLALVGFNLGVEVGQLAIVAVFLPLAYGLRGSWIYTNLLLRTGSLLIALLAGAWLVERALDLNFLAALTNHR